MFFEGMDLCRTSDLKFSPMGSSHFESNFKRTINYPTTLANMNEPSKQMTYWRYHCSVTYVTHQWRSYHENFSFIVTYHNVTGQRQCQPEWKQMEISVTQASNGFIHSEEIIWWAWVTLMTWVVPVTAYFNFRWFTDTFS